MITLTQEQARVLAETVESPPRVVDPQTQHVYFLVNGEVYARAQALFEEEHDVISMYAHLAELDPNDWQDRAEAMIYRRGDVVMVDHPFSDARGSKVRPMLIVQSDVRNKLLNHTVVVMLTTNLSFVGSDPTQVLVDITTPDGASSGLSAVSAIRCGNLFTLHERFILHKIGALSAMLMQKVDDALRTALELP